LDARGNGSSHNKNWSGGWARSRSSAHGSFQMAEAPIAAMKAVAERLDGLGVDYAFLGGSHVGEKLHMHSRT